MASSLVWGPDDATTTATTSTQTLPSPSMHLSTLHTTHIAQHSMTEDDEPPSPNGLSAASILATLSDSRPQTSQGYHEADEEDEQGGGIALETDEDTISMHTYPVIYATGASYSDLDLHSTHSSAIDEILDQHADALNSLSMDQDSSHTSHVQIPLGYQPFLYMSQDLLSNIHDLDAIQNENPTEEYLNHLNKDRFISIHSFYRHFVDHPNDSYIELDLHDPPRVVRREDLKGDGYDFQGIDWNLRRTTRASIRSQRTKFEMTRLSPHLKAVRQCITPTPDVKNLFSFKKMDMVADPYIPHFQLRNLIAATSYNDVFYAQKDLIMRTDSSGTPPTTVMNLKKQMTEGTPLVLTTLDAADDMVIAGGFEGEYAMANLTAATETPYTLGRVKDRSRYAKSFITNHIHLFASRHTYSPQAVLCSNDNRLRILDCLTNTFTHSFEYSQAVNCSATSPDGRMRVVVGDFRETLITNAETGRPFETMNTHSDDVFACDWADDGIHVATAAQDSTIVIWDARNWKRPLQVMYSELSIPRCVKFSPVGGGPRVLVSAEADDYVNIIDAQTFDSKQTFDFFGCTAGISMTPDGQSLFVAAADSHLGGIMELERCGSCEKPWHSNKKDSSTSGCSLENDEETMVDWGDESTMNMDGRVVCGWHERDRRGLSLSLASLVV